MKKMHDVTHRSIIKVSMRLQGESTQTGAHQSYFGLNLYDSNPICKAPAMTADWGNKGGRVET